jgi:hypothetical protein
VADNKTDDWFAPIPSGKEPVEIDTTVAHPARVYDYWLGGKDNYAADRDAAEYVISVRPTILRDIRANRAFLGRAVAWLAREQGMRQFLDVGTGIPTSPNVHEIVQTIAPESRVVYVDNDPLVHAHARALLASAPQGATTYIEADLRESSTILSEAARTLDFASPVAVVLVGILHLISDEQGPHQIVSRLMDTMPSGSCLVISHPASDVHAEVVAESAKRYNQSVATAQTRRSLAEVSRFFDGLELFPPGIVQCHRWRPGPEEAEADYEVSGWGGVGRKP